MIEVPITLVTLCILGLAYTVLSVTVGVQRGRAGISLGFPAVTVAIGEEDKATSLLLAVRRHGQFAEYVPISILLLAVLESNQANWIAVLILAGALLVSRICMLIGLGLKAPNPLRAAGNLLQWGMIAGASGFGLMLAIQHSL